MADLAEGRAPTPQPQRRPGRGGKRRRPGRDHRRVQHLRRDVGVPWALRRWARVRGGGPATVRTAVTARRPGGDAGCGRCGSGEERSWLGGLLEEGATPVD